MGFNDRDYQRGDYYERQPGFYLGGPRTLTTNLVIVMFVIYAIQLATRGPRPDAGWFTDTFSLHADFIKRPWLAFQLLTYGFLHDVWQFQHILFNMIALWFFGRSVEYRYGKREYFTFFLISVVFAGATWVIADFIAQRQWMPNAQMLGASGGIMAVLVLFCLNFPHQLIYIWGIFPIPAWILAILYVGNDLLGAFGHQAAGGLNVAFTAHLGGALFALIYFQSGMRLERFVPSGSMLERLQPKPKLKVHDPESADETDEAVDEILKKIQDHGRDSLTRRERRILEEASREYQKRRH
jgi:membrane associated rhomboid family serine protease